MSSFYRLERFTLQARQVLTLAQEEAARSHHNYIGTEHLLLGMFQVEGAMASRILADLGVEIGSVRQVIEKVLGRKDRTVIQQIIPTSRVKKVVEIAFEESRELRARSVGSQHLLLALMVEGEGIAAHVLEDLRVTEGRVREAMAALSAEGFHEDPGSEAPDPPLTSAARIGAGWQPQMGEREVQRRSARCSFCGKGEDQVLRLIAGPGVYICDQCIDLCEEVLEGERRPGGKKKAKPRFGLASALDDLGAVELLGALIDRFGATEPPPPALLKAVGHLHQARDQKQAAVTAQDYEAAKRHHDEELRLQADAVAQIEAWRKHPCGISS